MERVSSTRAARSMGCEVGEARKMQITIKGKGKVKVTA